MTSSAPRTRSSRRWLGLLLCVTLVATLTGVGPASASPSPLSVTVTPSSTTVASGSALTYTVVVTNTGSSKLTESKLTNQLNGLTNVVLTSSRGSCGLSGGLVTCEGGLLPGHATWTVTIRGLVTAADGETLHDTATATARKSSYSHTAAGTTSVLVSNAPAGPQANLSVAVSAPADAAPSSLLTYTLTVTNSGGANATDIDVVSTLPPGFAFVSATSTSLFSCAAPALPTVTCSGGAVDAGGNGSIRIVARAAATNERYRFTTVVDPEDTIPELDELDNTASHEVFVPAPAPPTQNIEFTKAVSTTQARVGDHLTYTVFLKNLDPKYPAERIRIVDGTQGLDAASVTASVFPTNLGAVCSVNASEVVCQKPDGKLKLDKNGKNLTITISGRVVAAPGSVIDNTATVSLIKNKVAITRTASTSTTARPGVDLTVTQRSTCAAGSAACPPIRARDAFDQVLTVGNSGLDDATGVVVREPLPAGVVLEGFSSTGGFACAVNASNVVTCSGGNVPGELSSGSYGGTTRQITLHLTAPNAAAPITTNVTVDPFNAIHEGDETNNGSSATTPIATGINLTVMKVANFDPVAPNGSLTYTLTVDNVGTADATGIRVRDILPAGVRFRSATTDPEHGLSCTHNGAATGGVVECTGGHLKGTYNHNHPVPQPSPGVDRATITIRTFAPDPEGELNNQALVDPEGAIAEIDETDNLNRLSSDVAVGGGGAFNELTVSSAQFAPVGAVAPNGTLVYRLTVANTGSDPASQIVVHDYVPAGARFRSATSSPLSGGNGGFACFPVGGIVECRNGTLQGGGSATITITLFAPDQPGPITNQAVIDPANAIPEANEWNNVDTTDTLVQVGGAGDFIELTIGKSGPADVVPNGLTSYQVTVGNSGSDPAFNVAVRDWLPAGTVFVSATDAAPGDSAAFACGHQAGVVDCTGGFLPAGGSRTIQISVRAPNDHGIVIVNQARVDPDNRIAEANETNNTATTATTVTSQVNLTITKQGPPSASQSQNADYTLTVKNVKAAGKPGQFVSNVTVVDPLPVGLIVLGVETPGANNDFACQVEENPINKVTCTGSLAPDEEQQIVVHTFVTAEDGAALDNEGKVDPANSVVEFNENDNSSTVRTAVVPAQPNLVLDKDDLHNTVTPGQNQVYTVTVHNIGPVPATGVSVTDTLPSDVTFISATATAGFTCTGTTTVTCTGDLPPNAGTAIKITVKVSDTASGPITNTASATVTDELDPADNSDSVTTAVGASGFDLAISDIVDTPDPVQPGRTVTYTYQVTNNGTATASNVLVRASVPSDGIDFVSGNGSEGFACTYTDASPHGTLDCTGDLGPGVATTITVKLLVTAGAPPSFTYSATVDPANAFTESDETNNQAATTTTKAATGCTSCIDLAMAPIDDTPDPVAPGGTVTYTVTVGNVGDTTTQAHGGPVRIDMVLDPNTTFASISATNGFTCSQPNPGNPHLRRCTGELGPGAGTVITLAATVGPVPPGTSLTMNATASLTAGVDVNGANNNGSATTTVS